MLAAGLYLNVYSFTAPAAASRPVIVNFEAVGDIDGVVPTTSRKVPKTNFGVKPGWIRDTGARAWWRRSVFKLQVISRH